MDAIKKIKKYEPKHDHLLAFDSDGTVFNTMEIKHKEVFIPLALKIWKLDKIKNMFNEIAEFINLRSNFRGTNRFPSLLLTFKFLEERKHNIEIPDYSSLEEFIKSDNPLSTPALIDYNKDKDDKFLEQVIKWSQLGNEKFAELSRNLPPFSLIEKILKMVYNEVDTIIVSSAPMKALKKDWGQNNLLKYIDLIAGQEIGEKKEQLRYIINGKYEKHKVMMIGDALGDLEAAEDNGVYFYPVNPGSEEESWEKFYKKDYKKFINGNYTRNYEKKLIGKFRSFLPTEKPWNQEVG